MMVLKGKTAIITGAADGIGKAIAVRFAKEGANVVICDINEQRGKTAAKPLNKKNQKAVFVKCNVSVPEEVDRVVKESLSHFKRIDILVNNAGIMNNYPIEELKIEDWDRTMTVNLKGAFLFSKAVAPHMKKQESGKIINISSLAGKTGGLAVGIDYAASKGGLLAFTKSLARELALYNINVNAVCPGTTKTGLIGKFTSKEQDGLLKKVPLGRLGKPADVASCALFLASDESSYMTGTTIDVNGGLFM